MTTTINASTTAGLVQTADTSGVLALQTAGTTAVSISASQVVTLTNALPVASGGSGVTTSTGTGANVLGTTPSFTSTIGVGAATASASGAGITFPATQSASSDANTLDDYEEGTWTPAFSASGATFTYNAEVGGWYTKIGRVVTVGFTVGSASRTGGSGAITITGLPFTQGSVSNAFSAGSVGTVNQWAHSSSYVQWGIRLVTGSSSIAIFEFGQAGAQVGDLTAQVAIIPTGTSTNFTASLTYYI
jgi:hypothetical protein